jgi:hypothetical protein
LQNPTLAVRDALAVAGGVPLALGWAPLAPAERRNPAASRGVEAALAAPKAATDVSGVRCIAVDGTSGTILMLDNSRAADRQGQPLQRSCA